MTARLSLEEALRDFIRRGPKGTSILDSLYDAHLAGSDVSPNLERLCSFRWFSSFFYILQASVPFGSDPLEKLDLTQEEKESLSSHIEHYLPRLGRMASNFWKESIYGYRAVIDYVDVFSRYAVEREILLFDAGYYSGDKVLLRSTDKGSSLLWLAKRLVEEVNEAYISARDRGLKIDTDEVESLQAISKEIEAASHNIVVAHSASPDDEQSG